MTSSERDPHERTGYWYELDEAPERTGPEVLNALRDYRSAQAQMRKRTTTAMGVGETDLAAVRTLLAAQHRGQLLTPTELARRLGISPSSVTTLLDRLERSGHVSRQSNPADRRGLVILATPHSDREVREALGRMHDRMIAVADGLPAETAAQVVLFLRQMVRAAEVTDEESTDA